MPEKSYELSQLGGKYMEQKNYSKAIELCRQAVELEPKNKQALVVLAMCFSNL